MDIKSVLISDKMDQMVVDSLVQAKIKVLYQPGLAKEKLLDVIKDFDALIVRSGTKVTKQVIEAATKLKLVARAGVGIDNVDCDAATKKNILVINAPSSSTNSVNELTSLFLLSLARPIIPACNKLKEGVWNRTDFFGVQLRGKTLGVVGMGRIGRAVANTAMTGLGMKILGYDPVVPKDMIQATGAEAVELSDIWKRSDYITFHVPLLDSTQHLFNSKAIDECKKGVRVINCARGGIIDELALLDGLKSGKISGAALDCFEKEPPVDREELIQHPSVIATPHMGASTYEAQEAVGAEIVDQILGLLEGKPASGSVNAVNPFVKR